MWTWHSRPDYPEVWRIRVDFYDVSNLAVRLVNSNVIWHGLEKRNTRIGTSNLFEVFDVRHMDPYDLIIYNHPFFPEEPGNFPGYNYVLKQSMLGGTTLLPRFYDESKEWLKDDGIIIQTYWDFAGPENDPRNNVEKHGYYVYEKHPVKMTEGLQKGNHAVYLIKKR